MLDLIKMALGISAHIISLICLIFLVLIVVYGMFYIPYAIIKLYLF